jgi:hypothetical protein
MTRRLAPAWLALALLTLAPGCAWTMPKTLAFWRGGANEAAAGGGEAMAEAQAVSPIENGGPAGAPAAAGAGGYGIQPVGYVAPYGGAQGGVGAPAGVSLYSVPGGGQPAGVSTGGASCLFG